MEGIHPLAHIGAVALTVKDLERSLEFYQRLMGFRLYRRKENVAHLGAGGPDLLVLRANPTARRYHGTSGLYHFAVLLPNRRELARVTARLFKVRYPNYPTDHIMTKTTYLDDPEGNGIELYCESPEDGIFSLQNGQFFARRADGSWSNGREPLDLEALFAYLEKDDRLDLPLPPQTVIGHFHIHVADLEQTRFFYHEQLGFDDMGIAAGFRMGMVSAGGYHHHVGYNTWQGEGAPSAPPDALGLEALAFSFPNLEAWQIFRQRLEEIALPYREQDQSISVTDPSGNKLIFFVRG